MNVTPMAEEEETEKSLDDIIAEYEEDGLSG